MLPWSKILSCSVVIEERQLDLVIVRRLPPMYLRVALPTDREQIARQLLKHADVSEMMDLGRWPLAAHLALAVGAFENVLAPLPPKGLAEVPPVGSEAIERVGHLVAPLG